MGVADQVTTEVLGAFGDLQSIVLALVSGLFALVVIAVAVRIGLKYMRRGALHMSDPAGWPAIPGDYDFEDDDDDGTF